MQLTHARPGAGLCGCGSSGRGGGGRRRRRRRRRRAGPAAIIAATCSAVTPSYSAVTAACRDAGHACSGSPPGAPCAVLCPPRRCPAALHPPTRSTHHGISLPALRWPLRWQPDLLDFTLPPTPSAITPVVTTSENWVAEMESEIQEFDQLTAQHGMPPNSAPGGAGWKQSMEEELELHLAKT